MLFNRVEPLLPSWISDQHDFRSRNNPVATEQVLAQSNQRFRKRCQKLIFKMAAVEFQSAQIKLFVSTRLPNAHHQVSIQLDYRGDVKNMFVCIEVLRPSQPNGVMSSVVSLPNHTFTGQA